MNELNNWGYQHATDQQRNQKAQEIVDRTLREIRPRLVAAIEKFLASPISAMALYVLELGLLVLVREIGRLLLQAALQALEPDNIPSLPKNLIFQCGGYRRRSKRTPNRSIATRFGAITLWRTGYRSWQRGEETIFPLEILLGLTEKATPAMLSWIGKTLAAAGMSQQAMLEVIREQAGVAMGVKRLRAITHTLAERLEPLRQTHQVEALLDMLKTAQASRGGRKPVLCVGRDGITLRHRIGFYEVATAATVSVYDRAGKRLGTIYLAYPPELGQATMDAMITQLVQELFSRLEGPLPRLAYVTDSGSNETDYYRRVLRKMKHPITGAKLQWTRVADYYHVSERVWTMAEALFAKNERRQAEAWAGRMLKNLKRPSGVRRVLHSAASLLSRRKLGKTRRKNFQKAYRHLQARSKHLKYDEYLGLHIPIGSGVTEAACKTVYTQRLKLSGMRWSPEGARRILTLRTILLSGTWESTYGASLTENVATIRPYAQNPEMHERIAA